MGTCPLCGKDIVEKVNKKGDVFYGCSGYPNCNMIFKDAPTDQTCPQCGNVILRKESKTQIKEYCCNPKCNYQKIIKKEEE